MSLSGQPWQKFNIGSLFFFFFLRLFKWDLANKLCTAAILIIDQLNACYHLPKEEPSLSFMLSLQFQWPTPCQGQGYGKERNASCFSLASSVVTKFILFIDWQLSFSERIMHMFITLACIYGRSCVSSCLKSNFWSFKLPLILPEVALCSSQMYRSNNWLTAINLCTFVPVCLTLNKHESESSLGKYFHDKFSIPSWVQTL